MQTQRFFYLAALILSSQTALAGPHRSVDYARVIDSQPVYVTVEQRVPERHCRVETLREEHYHPGHTRTDSALIGGVIGGAVGRSIGHNRDSRAIGTAVGAAVGAAIGNDVGRKYERPGYTQVSYRDVERCQTVERVHTSRVLKGYDVTYRYQGKIYSTFMEQHPGDRIPVSVSVQPLRR